MRTQKIIILTTLLIITIILTTTSTVTSTENKTITIDTITFDAPITNNNTTNMYKTSTGGTTWAYEDYQNNVSVYICSERDPTYSVNEEFDELTGFSQMRPVGDRWVIVCADSQELKDMCFMSAHGE